MSAPFGMMSSIGDHWPALGFFSVRRSAGFARRARYDPDDPASGATAVVIPSSRGQSEMHAGCTPDYLLLMPDRERYPSAFDMLRVRTANGSSALFRDARVVTSESLR
jgi:hypothetical protein